MRVTLPYGDGTSAIDPNRIEFFAPDGKRLFDLRLRGQPGRR
jgi:hypothetical protein